MPGSAVRIRSIKNSYGLHDHADFVVAVFPFPEYVQSQIDFAVGLQPKMLNHGTSPLQFMKNHRTETPFRIVFLYYFVYSIYYTNRGVNLQ